MKDDRIVYGARCVWWDSIDNVAALPGSGLPCCPHCGSVLFEMSPREWWEGVELHDATNPGYRAMVEWWRGKCFPNMPAVERAYADFQRNLELLKREAKRQEGEA